MYTPLAEAEGFTLSVYPSAKNARECSTREVGDVASLRGVLVPRRDPGDKDLLPLVMKRRFEGQRQKENASGDCLLVLDVDDSDLSPEEASERLLEWDVPHLLYTTYSHTPAEPRYRVVVPVLVPDRRTYRHLARWLFNEVLEAAEAPESWAINSGFYAPTDDAEIYDELDRPVCFVPPDLPEYDPPSASGEKEELDYERAAEALKFTPCEDLSYEEWIEVGMELKSTGDPRAFDLWDEWSRMDAGRYQASGPYSTEAKWETIAEDGGRTIASLYHRALEGGWAPPRPKRTTAAEDFADVEVSELEDPAAGTAIHHDGWPIAYEDFLDAISERFAVVNEGGHTRVYEVLQDEARVVQYTEAAFRTYMDAFTRQVIRPPRTPGGDPQLVTVKMGRAWLEDPDRRRYFPEVTFNPNKKQPPRVFNHWRGWPWAKAVRTGERDELITHFLDHLKSNICDDDVALYQWLVAWIAQMIQYPGLKPGTACVLRSGQGSGKSLVGFVLNGVVGAYGLQVDDIEMLTSGFNAHLRNNIFVFADEVSSGGASKTAKDRARKLKSVITGLTRMVQPKGVDAKQEMSYTRLMFSSNDLWALLAERDDRRYTVFEVSEKRKNDTAYFGPLFKAARDPVFLRELFCYFRDVDLSKLPDPASSYKTEGLAMQKIESLSGIELWWYEVLSEGRLPGDEAWDERPSTAHVYELYRMSVDRFSKPMTDQAAIPMISRMASCESSRAMVGGVRMKRFEMGDLERARAAFEEYVGAEFEWPDGSDED